MNRQLRIAAAILFGLSFCMVARSQDAPPPTQQTAPPSLGDVARKYRAEKAAKEKGQAATKNTFTNDGLAAGKDGGPMGTALPGAPGSGNGEAAYENALQSLNGALQKIDLLEATDRATLIKNATNGNSADFPGRRAWEDRLVAAQHNYVTHGRELIQSIKALMLETKKLGDEHPEISENDPRVVSTMTRLRDKNVEAQKLSGDMQALVQEGRDRAAEASRH